MNACDAYLDKIMLSVDGELSEQEEKSLQAHLAVCDRCRSLYSAYREIQSGIIQMDETPPENLSESVMRRIRREKQGRKPHIRNYRFTLIAAAACLVLVVAVKGLDFGRTADSSAYSMENAEVAEAAPAEVMDDTALIPAYDPENTGRSVAETTEETVEEVEIPAPAAEAAAVAEDAQMEHMDAEANVGDASDDISTLRALLEQEGYFGDLVEMQDTTEEMLLQAFPECEKLTVEPYTVYKVSCEAFEAVESQMHYGTVVSTVTAGDGVFLYLG